MKNRLSPRGSAGLRIVLAAAAALAGFALTAQAQEGASAERKVLRVCADPNNLPFSHRNQEGFENKIAELFARDLGWGLDYTWFPQRIGFVRNTLRARDPASGNYKCDLIMGVPVGFELASTTKPYYRSTYALVYAKGRGLDGVKTPDDLPRLEGARLKALKLGVFAQTPPVDWLLRHGLIGQAVFYQRMSGDPEDYPGEVIERDLASGQIDAAFVWGPIAGYFAKRLNSPQLAVVPFGRDPEIKFDYPIAMGVRFGEREWKAQVEQLIERNSTGIQAILKDYNVPLLDDQGRIISGRAN
jgi:mxaJ protein